MRTRFLALPLLMPLALGWAASAKAQVPVKLFTAKDGQEDEGTAKLAAAVREHLAAMPKYKLWQGKPSDFPKSGVLLDIQGIDITGANDDLIGSVVLLVCSAPDPHAVGYYAVRYRELVELRSGDADLDDAASEFLAEMDKRVPAATAETEKKTVAPVRKPAPPGSKKTSKKSSTVRQ